MSTVTQQFCDRCGKLMKYVGWTAKLKNISKKGKTVKIHKLLNGNLDGYSYSDNYYELCADCTKELEDFLRNNFAIPCNSKEGQC